MRVVCRLSARFSTTTDCPFLLPFDFLVVSSTTHKGWLLLRFAPPFKGAATIRLIIQTRAFSATEAPICPVLPSLSIRLPHKPSPSTLFRGRRRQVLANPIQLFAPLLSHLILLPEPSSSSSCRRVSSVRIQRIRTLDTSSGSPFPKLVE